MSPWPRLWPALALVAVALGAGIAVAGDPPKKPAEPQPDAEFLEFLGSVDSTADGGTEPDDASWMEYLAQTDIDKAAQKARKPATPAPAPVPAKVKTDE